MCEHFLLFHVAEVGVRSSVRNKSIDNACLKSKRPRSYPPLRLSLPVIHLVLASVLVPKINLAHAVVAHLFHACTQKLHVHTIFNTVVIDFPILGQSLDFGRSRREKMNWFRVAH